MPALPIKCGRRCRPCCDGKYPILELYSKHKDKEDAVTLTSEQRPQIGCLKVSSKSSPSSVAGAIAGMVKDGVLVEIQSVGAGAVNQAVKAIAISRGFLSPVGIEIACIPSFADIVIDGEYRTAIRFTVEPRSVRDRVAGASGVSVEE